MKKIKKIIWIIALSFMTILEMFFIKKSLRNWINREWDKIFLAHLQNELKKFEELENLIKDLKNQININKINK